MIKIRRKLAIILTVMMMISLFEVVGIYAESNDGGAPAATKLSTKVSVTPDQLKIEDLALLSGNGCVVLRWKKINVSGVTVDYYVDGKKVNVSKYNYMPGRLNGEYVMYKIDKPVSENASLPKYSFKVQAKSGDVAGAEVTSNERAPVRTIAYRVTIKKGTTLKRHGGNGPKKLKVKKGQKIYCYGFGGGGCYMFRHQGSIFYCAKIRAGKPKAIYTTAFEYTPEEAELFLNQKGVSSRTGKFIWVNSYTQRLFYMEGSRGNWRCVDNWSCATGKASSPTPTGLYGSRTVKRKVKKHHGIKWWMPFSEWNAIHGQRKGWKFGKPASHGCVRNPIAKAEWMYKRTPKKSGILLF